MCHGLRSSAKENLRHLNAIIPGRLLAVLETSRNILAFLSVCTCVLWRCRLTHQFSRSELSGEASLRRLDGALHPAAVGYVAGLTWKPKMKTEAKRVETRPLRYSLNSPR
jgi:hypothetical protein